MPIMGDTSPAGILAYWLGRSAEGPSAAESQRGRWYQGGPGVDAEIAERFGPYVELARDQGLSDWEGSPHGTLALVILLDQFTRNIYRGTRDAYSGDALALEIAIRALARGRDRSLSVPGRIFLYHPFHHAEDLIEQERSVTLLEGLERVAPGEWKPYVRQRVEGFGRHRDIVARFGRFPHRNCVLGRPSSREETAYLQDDPETFGQG